MTESLNSGAASRRTLGLRRENCVLPPVAYREGDNFHSVAPFLCWGGPGGLSRMRGNSHVRFYLENNSTQRRGQPLVRGAL